MKTSQIQAKVARSVTTRAMPTMPASGWWIDINRQFATAR
jgi:hypothetical protein